MIEDIQLRDNLLRDYHGSKARISSIISILFGVGNLNGLQNKIETIAKLNDLAFNGLQKTDKLNDFEIKDKIGKLFNE